MLGAAGLGFLHDGDWLAAAVALAARRMGLKSEKRKKEKKEMVGR